MIDEKMSWETPEFIHGISVLLREKPFDKIITKALEELGELNVKLLQYMNKPEVIGEGDIEEEIADLEMHLRLLKYFFPVSPEIREAKIKKFLASKDYQFYLKQYEIREQLNSTTEIPLNKLDLDNIPETKFHKTPLNRLDTSARFGQSSGDITELG